MKLTAKGMTVESFETYKNVTEKIKNSKFKIMDEINWTENIFPSLIKFEKAAIKFFKLGFFAKIIIKIVPKEFSYNVISGYLMHDLFKNHKVYTYNATICKKIQFLKN